MVQIGDVELEWWTEGRPTECFALRGMYWGASVSSAAASTRSVSPSDHRRGGAGRAGARLGALRPPPLALKPELPRASDADRVTMIELRDRRRPRRAAGGPDRAGRATPWITARLRDELVVELGAEHGSDRIWPVPDWLPDRLLVHPGADALRSPRLARAPGDPRSRAPGGVRAPWPCGAPDGLEAVLPGADRIDLSMPAASRPPTCARVCRYDPLPGPGRGRAYIEAQGLYRGDRIAKGFPEL
jgi:hypothetical protein